ncbi:MAG: CTP synthase [Spirochaetales bacterium]|nr:CTP synthase [Spirochaetales bacterium]MCF7939264.1 CTP synthase [Spirochaetales bacterium]
MSKFIFVTGGVCSSLGKGLAASSLGTLLESRGLEVRMIKIDPYLNVDAGTMNPYQHGEVYVTDDGAETDLDLGNYHRFTQSPLSQDNSITTGQVYQEVIKKEREGRYLGRTVQVIPHITDEIKRRVYQIGKEDGVDITITEVGGTVGDIESIPFLEAVRQIIHELGRENAISVHLTLIPEVSGGELKTKPTQHSVKNMQQTGLQPDVLLCRVPHTLEEGLRRKIALFTNVDPKAVISANDVDTTIYEIPIIYHEQNMDGIVLDKLELSATDPDLSGWERVVHTLKNAERTARVGIVGKYIELHDSYKSVYEALYHGAIANQAKLDLIKIDAESIDLDTGDNKHLFDEVDGILVPGGFGQRGIEGMIEAIRYGREHKIPTFGICLGMQTMIIEYARSVMGLAEANSTEFYPDGPHPVISLLEEQVDVQNFGGTMRLGHNTSSLEPGTRIHDIYNKKTISERHRHRFEVSNTYREAFLEAGLVISGQTPNGALVEAVEWPDHPWGIGVQYHPEFRSTPLIPHPLFQSFIEAVLNHETMREPAKAEI